MSRLSPLVRLLAVAGVAPTLPASPVSLDRAVLSGGGGAMSSPRFSVIGSAGQAVAATAASSGPRFSGRSGFWSQNFRWINATPVAAAASVTVRGTAATALTLGGVDADGDPVTFQIISQPGTGTLSGAGPERMYTPGGGFTTGDVFTYVVNDGLVDSIPATIQLVRTHVVGRWVFYNQSAWDGNDVVADARDDAAVAVDKSALLTGVKAGFGNYTSHSRGLNGIMVDIEGLPLGVELSSADFGFRMGNDSVVSGWALAPAPLAVGGVTVRRGAGAGGSDRVTLVWGSDAVSKRWLQVRVRANPLTGLWQDDLFYFGNAVGETGNHPGIDAVVDATDEILTRLNPRSLFVPAPVTSAYDFNRDKQVNATDQILARLNTTSGFTVLELITPGAAGAPALAGTAYGGPGSGSGRSTAAGKDSGSVGLGDPGGVSLLGSGTPDGDGGGSPLGVLALADGRIVLHGRSADGREPRLEMAEDLSSWEPAPYVGESYSDGGWFWLVGSAAENRGRFFRLAAP